MITDGYTRDELRREVLIWAGRELSLTRFYEWIRYAFVDRKPIYSDRDRSKLLYFAECLNRVRSYQEASIQLLKALDESNEFPLEDQDYGFN